MKLTQRQTEVIKLVAEGKRPKEIGALLGIASKTAEWHLQRVYELLGVNDSINLVRHAIKRGILNMEEWLNT